MVTIDLSDPCPRLLQCGRYSNCSTSIADSWTRCLLWWRRTGNRGTGKGAEVKRQVEHRVDGRTQRGRELCFSKMQEKVVQFEEPSGEVISGAIDSQPNWWSGRRRSLIRYLKRNADKEEEGDGEEKLKKVSRVVRMCLPSLLPLSSLPPSFPCLLFPLLLPLPPLSL